MQRVGGLGPSDPAYPSGVERVDGRGRTRGIRWRLGAWFDPSGPHVGEKLVGDFGEHFFSQTSHAQNVVSSPVDVVSERNKLTRKRSEEMRYGRRK